MNVILNLTKLNKYKQVHLFSIILQKKSITVATTTVLIIMHKVHLEVNLQNPHQTRFKSTCQPK